MTWYALMKKRQLCEKNDLLILKLAIPLRKPLRRIYHLTKCEWSVKSSASHSNQGSDAIYFLFSVLFALAQRHQPYHNIAVLGPTVVAQLL
jgi:hypothetical protein